MEYTHGIHQYDAPAFVILDGSGTGHDQSCQALAELDGTPELRAFADGGFDLFCPHGCLDYTIVRKGREVAIEEAPTFTPGPKPKGEPIESREWTTDEVEAWLLDLGRKVEPHEVDSGLVREAVAWAKAWTGTFEFMVDMSETARSKGRLSPGQAKGVLNCWRADLVRGQRKPKAEASGLDLSNVPAGRYAVPGGDTRLKVMIQKPTKGNWEGWAFVKDAAVYGEGKRYGKQAPGGTYSGDIVEELRAIVADPRAAAAEYGHLTSTCGICGRPLEDAESVERGIGPVCIEKVGW